MGGMRGMPPIPSPALLFLLGWIAMMVAMMFPSVAPTVTVFTAVSKDRRQAGGRAAPAWVFLVGYLTIWGLFGAGAYLLSLVVPDVSMATPGLRASSPLIGGLILIVAGFYQWSPLKRSCLEHCRSPLAFFQREWREGAVGAFRSGVAHGTRCVGCSAGLMFVLFAVGLMNLGWMVLLAAVIFAENVVPHGPLIGRLAGVALLISGVAMSAAPWLGRFPA
jgi:predicted metal-binding membrane protein